MDYKKGDQQDYVKCKAGLFTGLGEEIQKLLSPTRMHDPWQFTAQDRLEHLHPPHVGKIQEDDAAIRMVCTVWLF